jgi:hypothetical protein
MAFSEVYQALQTGVVDGTENPPSNFYTQKMQEVQKFLALTDHGYLGYAVIVNKKFWDGLPPDIRKTLEGAMKDATKFANDLAQKDNADAMIVSRGEFSVAERITKSVHANHDAMRVLDGIRETTLWWKQIGRQCRGTPDVRGDGFITELKTGETADPRAFPWKMRRFCYHGQLAFYSDGALLSVLDEPQAHYVVAVEAAAPHVVTVFRLTPKAIEQGRRLVRLWFERLLACEAANEWPAYAQSVVDLDVPEEELEVLDAETVAAAEPDWAKAAF